MVSKFTDPDDIDRFLGWSLGTAARLARRGRLPHYVLPDGSIRFCQSEIEPLIRHVQVQPVQEVTHAG